MADEPEVIENEAEYGDPEFAEVPAGGEAEPVAAEAAEEGEPKPDEAEPVATKPDGEQEPEKEKTVEELRAELEEERRVRKGLTRRLGVVSAEKKDISKKLQESIAAVPPRSEAPTEVETEQPVRTDFKTQAEFAAAVQAEAVRVAAQQRAIDAWNAKCNDVEDKGSKAFGAKWAEAKNNLAILDDEGRIPIDLLNTALETDNPAQVLFELGADLDKATELMAMPPLKRAIAMDRMAQKKPPERARTSAPAPVDPINGRGGGNDAPSDRDSDAEWHRKEGLREAARRRERLGLAR